MYNTSSTLSISENRKEYFPTCRKPVLLTPKPEKYSTSKENSTVDQWRCKIVNKRTNKQKTNQYNNFIKNKIPQQRSFIPRMQSWHIWI